jgi:hypothetical protein
VNLASVSPWLEAYALIATKSKPDIDASLGILLEVGRFSLICFCFRLKAPETKRWIL